MDLVEAFLIGKSTVSNVRDGTGHDGSRPQGMGWDGMEKWNLDVVYHKTKHFDAERAVEHVRVNTAVSLASLCTYSVGIITIYI